MADDRNAPATKGDIEDLRNEMKEQIGALRSEMRQSTPMLRSGIRHIHGDPIEGCRDGTTRLVEAFYTFAKMNCASLAAHGHETPALREQLGIIESKLADAKRKNHPPQS